MKHKNGIFPIMFLFISMAYGQECPVRQDSSQNDLIQFLNQQRAQTTMSAECIKSAFLFLGE